MRTEFKTHTHTHTKKNAFELKPDFLTVFTYEGNSLKQGVGFFYLHLKKC